MDTKNSKYKFRLLTLVRRTELLLFLAVLPFLIPGLKSVKGSYVVAGVQSHLVVAYGDENYEFDTYKTNVLDAVTEQGIVTYDQDVFSSPRDTKLAGQQLKLVITKSLPVVINDGGKHVMGRTVFSNPEKILDQNNIPHWPEDKIDIELIVDPVTSGGVGQLVTIRRAPVYTVEVDGKKKEVRTWEDSVTKIVELSSTKLNPNDIVKPGIKEVVSSGAVIKITRINYADVSEVKSIDYSTVYQGSTSLALGQEKVSVTGITGSKKVTYRVTYKNGEEVSRVSTGSKVTKAKRDAKILRGAVTGKCKWGSYYETHYGAYTTAFHYAKSEHHPEYIGRYILVTNLSTGKSIKVKVVDAGPTEGLLDLSTTAINAIGGMGGINLNGYFNVSVQLLD